MLRKILDFRACRCQYFRDTICWWPTRLSFLWPPFTFVKCGRIKSATFRKTRTRHSVLYCKAFYCTPHIIMGHLFLPMFILEYYPCVLVYRDFIPYLLRKQWVPFPRYYNKKQTTKSILKIFLTKHLTNRFLYTILIIVKGVKPDDRCQKHLWGPEVQTPSYILSPLDSGPQNL